MVQKCQHRKMQLCFGWADSKHAALCGRDGLLDAANSTAFLQEESDSLDLEHILISNVSLTQTEGGEMQEDQGECFKSRQKFLKGLQSALAIKKIFNKLDYMKIFLKILHENISRSSFF